MGYYRIILACSFAAFAAVSCKRDMPPEPVEPVDAVYSPGQGVFITNEGNFTWGNSTVSFFSFDHQLVVQDAFEQANGIPLGDVCQSMVVIGSKGYVVVNNSGKIAVVDMNDFNLLVEITGLTSPRYLLPVSPTKAFVSDLYNDGVYIVDLNTNSVTGEIDIPGWTERMAIVNGMVYITCVDRTQLYIIDPTTNLLTDSIAVSVGGNSLALDSAGKLWLLCMGDYSASVPGALHRIDTSTNQVEWSAGFANSHYPINMVMNTTRTEMYFIDGNVYEMSVTSTQLPSSPFILANGRNFYGLGMSSSGDLFVADARDYVLPGKVYRYNSSVLLDSVQVGISPGNFCFY